MPRKLPAVDAGAAGFAAGEAAGDAAGEGEAAGDGDAAGLAAGEAAGEAAGDPAGDAAGDAAGAVVAGGLAAGAVVGGAGALGWQPTVSTAARSTDADAATNRDERMRVPSVFMTPYSAVRCDSCHEPTSA
jgi:hypothetical protein